VGQLRIKYGGRNKTRGAKPEHFKKASGGLIRHIIKQLETVGFVEKHDGGLGLALGPAAALARTRTSLHAALACQSAA
jgi:small subunit ribosomal protein S19e